MRRMFPVRIIKGKSGHKRLFWLITAFLLGWFSAKTSTQISNVSDRTEPNELHIDNAISDRNLLPSLQTEERHSCPNTVRDRFDNSSLFRELVRRRSIKTVGYMRNIVLVKLKTIQQIVNSNGVVGNLSAQVTSLANSFEELLKESTLYLLTNLHKIEEFDGVKIRRRELLDRLSKLVQTRITALQNPLDCTRAKILLADVSWPCGYGCHVHYFMFCLNMAYATKRTLILESLKTYCGQWWAQSYMPLSDKCSMEDVGKDEVIVGMNSSNYQSDVRVMRCTFGFFTHAQNVSVAPPVVPKDLAPFLLVLHGRPEIWFLGQLAHYVMRPLPRFRSQLNELAFSSNLSTNHPPVVGVHVRRTDKVYYHEGEFHNLSEYMVHVDRYFDYIEEVLLLDNRKNRSSGPGVQRQIYLASDDPKVFEEVKIRYPQYVVHNTTGEKFTQSAEGKYPTDSRTRIAMEIFLLSLTDYIVCTLSSNVCRVAYELMQARQGELGDAGDLVQSIDTSYFWDSGQTITCEMVQDEKSANLNRGDIVDVWSGNLNAGFEHRRLKNRTYFLDPPYKCVPRVIVGEM